jgi:hypothetical protein
MVAPGSPRARERAGDPQQPAWLQVGVDEFLGGSLVDHPPGAKDADMVGDALDVGQDVAGENDGAAAAHPGDQREHFGPPGRVQGRGGLVEDQQLRVTHQGAGQPEPLGHAPGEPADPPAGRAGEACG